MSFLSKVTDFFTGGLGEKIVDGVQAYFPPDMTPEQRAKLEIAIKDQSHKREVELLTLAAEQDEEFNNRIRDLEGTAKDLTQFGWPGRIVVFFRGCQRPVWGGLVMYMDIQWFSGNWSDLSEQQESALWVINILVLGFLFGERAVKNVMPFMTQFMKQRAQK